MGTLVFRVQRLEDGTGPYQSMEIPPPPGQPAWMKRFLDCPVTSAINDGDNARHPGPESDGLHCVSDSEYFGFATLQQARNWFGGWGSLLWENYYSLTRWYVEDEHLVRHGRRQSCFPREYAKLIAHMDPRVLDLRDVALDTYTKPVIEYNY